MPPKARITKEMILNTVLDLTRQSGFETVNARSVAGRLQCSTRPIFTCYENMEELKREFLAFAYEFYQQYVADFRKSVKVSPCLVLPLSYIGFAREETQLFKLLFQLRFFFGRNIFLFQFFLVILLHNLLILYDSRRFYNSNHRYFYILYTISSLSQSSTERNILRKYTMILRIFHQLALIRITHKVSHI